MAHYRRVVVNGQEYRWCHGGRGVIIRTETKNHNIALYDLLGDLEKIILPQRTPYHAPIQIMFPDATEEEQRDLRHKRWRYLYAEWPRPTARFSSEDYWETPIGPGIIAEYIKRQTNAGNPL